MFDYVPSISHQHRALFYCLPHEAIGTEISAAILARGSLQEVGVDHPKIEVDSSPRHVWRHPVLNWIKERVVYSYGPVGVETDATVVEHRHVISTQEAIACPTRLLGLERVNTGIIVELRDVQPGPGGA